MPTSKLLKQKDFEIISFLFYVYSTLHGHCLLSEKICENFENWQNPFFLEQKEIFILLTFYNKVRLNSCKSKFTLITLNQVEIDRTPA